MVKFTGFFKKISFALFSPHKLTISFVFADKKAATKGDKTKRIKVERGENWGKR